MKKPRTLAQWKAKNRRRKMKLNLKNDPYNNRLYFIQIFIRDQRKPKYRFFGRPYAEKDDEILFEDQDRYLFYAHDFNDCYVQDDFVTIYCEMAESGRSCDDIFDALDEVYKEAPILLSCPLLREHFVGEEEEPAPKPGLALRAVGRVASKV